MRLFLIRISMAVRELMEVLPMMGKATSSERLVSLVNDGVVSGSRWRESAITRDFGHD